MKPLIVAAALACSGIAGAQPLPPSVDGAGLRRLFKQHAGHPILVNLFASWCEPCKAELPDLARLKQKFPQLIVLAIDVDTDDAALAKFLPSVPAELQVVRQKDGARRILPALRLPEDWNRAVPKGWTEVIPLSFLFDRRGRFANGSVGQLSAEALQAFEEEIR
jgi:thiol-disulfide isomerase/thioredoxin